MQRSSASARWSAWSRLVAGGFPQPLLSRYSIIGLRGSGSQTEVVSLRESRSSYSRPLETPQLQFSTITTQAYLNSARAP